MLRRGQLAWAKAYAARLIEEATRAGDQVALMAFGGQGVQLLQAPGPARRSVIGRVRPLGSGGGTPLAACCAAESMASSMALARGSSVRVTG